MDKQQLETMLAIEKSYAKITFQTHPKRRLIANCLHKLTDDERISDDIFALTMYIFDRFICQTSSPISSDHSMELIALSCYHLAKKLRTNTTINNENEQLSLIFSNADYNDEEIFNTEQMVAQTLDWDFAYLVPHDYIQIIFKKFFPLDNQSQIHQHVHILLSIAICEINTLSILPSLLACASIQAAIKGLSLTSHTQMEKFFCKLIHCNKLDLIYTEHIIEQFFQSCIQCITPSPRRRCLAPIDTSPQQQQRRRTKVK